ncbi:MAG: hypothetical protein ACOYEW_16630 [Anaerolineae bacterium]|jgi:hypothetical protein
MVLESVEKWIKRAGAIAMLVPLVAVYQGLWQGQRRSRGREVGRLAPATTGSSVFLVAASMAFFGALYRT